MLSLSSNSPLLSSTLIISTSSPYKPFFNHPKITLKPNKKLKKLPTKIISFADKSGNGPNKDPEERENKGDDVNGNGRPRFNLRWADLIFDPDPENVVAVGLAGVLTWASVQVLSQLFFISLAILAAALKYSFIAALLVFILITLL